MNRSTITGVLSAFLSMTAIALSGCAGLIAKEVMATPKGASDFVLSVDQSRQALQGTKDQIQSTLNAANTIGQTEEGSLQTDLQRLQAEVQKSNESVNAFRAHVTSMNETSDKFFANWTKELEKYATEEFRKHSEARVEITRGRYNQVLTSMQQADGQLQPLLAKLHDLVLYLNQNLNAEGVASIKTSIDGLNTEASELYESIDAAVREADTFGQVLSS